MLSKKINDRIDDIYRDFSLIGQLNRFNEAELFEIYDEVKTILESIDKGRLSKIDSLDYRFVFFALVEITKQWDSNSDLSLFELILVKLFNQQNKLKGKVLNEIYKCMDFLDRHLAATFLKQFIM